MKTYDGIEVKESDKVWVIGSLGIYEATVQPPVTDYYLFGPIEVKNSFSTRLAAEKFKYNESHHDIP